MNISYIFENSALIRSIPLEIVENNLKAGKFKIVSYKKNTVIHFDGETCSKLEIILSGSVAIQRIDQAGNLMTVTEFTNGDILGGNLVFSKTPATLLQ